MHLNFSFGTTLVIFMRSHVMPNVYSLQSFLTFVAIFANISIFFCISFKEFLQYFVSVHMQNMGKFQKFEIFLSYIIFFSKNHTFMKVDVLLFLTVSNSFGPSNSLWIWGVEKVCSTLSALSKLHMIKA